MVELAETKQSLEITKKVLKHGIELVQNRTHTLIVR